MPRLFYFARAFEKSFFDTYDPRKSRFRTFLRMCVDGLVANARKASARIKRGGQAQIESLDFEAAAGELSKIELPRGASMEEFFDREWIRSLLALAIEDLRSQCEAARKQVHFELFERYDLDPSVEGRPTYARLAAEYGISVTQVTNLLAFARSEFRRLVLERLRRITGTDEEFRSEARRLLGVEPQ